MANTKSNDTSTSTLSDRASDLKDKAGSALQSGIDAVKNNPGTTAAVVGGVAAAAAAFVARDRIAETAGTLRDKVADATAKTPASQAKSKS